MAEKRDGDIRLVFLIEKGDWCDYPDQPFKVRLQFDVPEAHMHELLQIGFYSKESLELRGFHLCDDVPSGYYEWAEGGFRKFRSI